MYNLYDKKNCAILIRTLKQALDHGLILGNIHKVTKFNEKTWLKPYIDPSMKLILKTKNDFQKDCFKLINNLEFGKIMENVRKHREIKPVKADKRRIHLVAESNYCIIKLSSENLLATEMNKTCKSEQASLFRFISSRH